MKKNDWILIASVAVYCVLFWQQTPGLNFLLMNFILLAGVMIKERSVLRNRSWWFAAAGAMVSAFCVFLYGDGVSIFANILSFLLVSSFVINAQNSLIVALILSVCSMAVTPIYMIADTIARRRKNDESTGKSRIGKKFLIILIALFVVAIFFLMYRSSNVLFYELTQRINLDFISFDWVAFVGLGTVLFYGFYYHHTIRFAADLEAGYTGQLHPSANESWMDKLMSMENEKFSGLVLLGLLNGLLLVVNLLDGIFLAGGSSHLPLGVSYSQYVHQGVGMLIASIIFAMLIILFYFRGRMNFMANGKTLRLLALCWIVQNLFMLVSTACRNEMYIEAYGLTYKRIGVFVYLLLAAIGLATTGWKVMKLKTNSYLFRTNSWLFYVVLIISCPVNWDAFIAQFNRSRTGAFDAVYISTLSYRAYPEVLDYLHTNPGTKADPGFRRNIFVFMQEQAEIRAESKWPSYVYAAGNVYENLLAWEQIGKVPALEASAAGLERISYLPQFSKIERLDVSANMLTDISEIGGYKQLTFLNLTWNQSLTSLKGVEGLENLQSLVITATGVNDLSPLLQLHKLRYIEGNIDSLWQQRLRSHFPGITIVINTRS